MLPELERRRTQFVATPVDRSGHVVTGETILNLGDPVLQGPTIGDGLALGAGVGTELVSTGARGEVGVGTLHAHARDRPFDANLTTERFAVPEEGRVGVGLEIVALARCVVRVPTERPLREMT